MELFRRILFFAGGGHGIFIDIVVLEFIVDAIDDFLGFGCICSYMVITVPDLFDEGVSCVGFEGRDVELDGPVMPYISRDGISDFAAIVGFQGFVVAIQFDVAGLGLALAGILSTGNLVFLR